MFGKEAHYDEKGFNWLGKNQEAYQTDGWYEYVNKVLNDEEKNTYYLKTRKLISGVKNYESKTLRENVIDRKEFLSLLCNNLNKTSKSGNKTCIKEVKELYDPFEFDGFSGTIYQHEFRILKPNKLVICCGKDYYRHINRDFDLNEKGDKLFWDIVDYSSGFNEFGKLHNNKPIVKLELSKESKEIIFGYSNIEILCCMHPSARMGSKRKEYENGIKNFLFK